MSNANKEISEQQYVVVAEYHACTSRFGEPDPYFISFLELCTMHSIPVYIVGEVSVRVMKKLTGNSGSTITYIGLENSVAGESCECTVTLCIRDSVLPLVAENTAIISVVTTQYGCCITRFSDIVFARDEAARYCSIEKIPHFSYATMFDVKRLFISKIINDKVHVRNKARLLRKDAFETE